ANGSFDGLQNFGDSILKLTPSLTVADYFTPFHQEFMDAWDLDLGSSGALFLPDSNLVFGGGKIPKSYLLRGSNYGKYVDDSTALESLLAGNSYLKSTPVLFSHNGKGLLISCTSNDFIRAYPYNASAAVPVSTTPAWQSDSSADGAGYFMTLSTNAQNPSTAVLWGTCNFSGQSQQTAAPGAMQAYNPLNGTLLWSSRTVASDNIPYWAKFVSPTVANGKVYVPSFPSEDQVTTPGQLICYGLLGTPSVPKAPAEPTVVSGNGEVQLSWAGVQQATSFKIYRQAGGAGPFLPIVAGLTTLSYKDTSVVNGTAYAYELVAANSFGLSAASPPVIANPKTSLVLYKTNCGGPAGDGFAGDNYFTGGTTASTTSPIKNGGSYVAVYQTARVGTFSYTFSGLVPGATDSVFLAFADLQQTRAGQRIMNVSVNGQQVISKLDLVSFVGPLTAYDATVTGQVAPNGTLTVSFSPDASSPVQSATVSAVEVYSGAWLRPLSPTMTATAALNGPLITWSTVAGRTTGYNIYRGTAKGAETLYLPGLTTSEEAYFDYNVSPGMTYYYYATATGPYGESAPGPEVSVPAYAFGVMASPSSITLSRGAGIPQSVIISLTNAPNATGVGKFHISNLPSGVTLAGEIGAVEVNQPLTVTLRASPKAVLGASTVTVLVNSGPNYRQTQFLITVTN
ncbi:MAG TPA: malectin domain-containing carbohydrate-binding protein, partial [Fimbriimonadaceae bacterium]